MVKYKRILLKLSGESLMGELPCGIDTRQLEYYTSRLREMTDLGVETAVVIGGGNIFRGLPGTKKGFDRYKGDQMGMLATVINGLAIQSSLESAGIPTMVFSAIHMEPVCEYYSASRAMQSLTEGNITVLTFGTGNPYFTTDTAAALRAVEIKAEVLLKGTRVDGVYTTDPEKDPLAKKFEHLTFDDAYNKNLKIMDLTAFTLCRENNLPVVVFNINQPDNLKKIIMGEEIGTVIKN